MGLARALPGTKTPAPSCDTNFWTNPKTISLEIYAYEKLKNAKQGRASFSQVVRRARFNSDQSTGASIVRELNALYATGHSIQEEVFEIWERREREKWIISKGYPV